MQCYAIDIAGRPDCSAWLVRIVLPDNHCEENWIFHRMPVLRQRSYHQAAKQLSGFGHKFEHYEDSGECKNINDGKVKKEWRLLGNPLAQGLPGCLRLRPKKSVSAAPQFCRDCLSGRLRYEDILGWNPPARMDRPRLLNYRATKTENHSVQHSTFPSRTKQPTSI